MNKATKKNKLNLKNYKTKKKTLRKERLLKRKLQSRVKNLKKLSWCTFHMLPSNHHKNHSKKLTSQSNGQKSTCQCMAKRIKSGKATITANFWVSLISKILHWSKKLKSQEFQTKSKPLKSTWKRTKLKIKFWLRKALLAEKKSQKKFQI
jgi:hypothetical protein